MKITEHAETLDGRRWYLSVGTKRFPRYAVFDDKGVFTKTWTTNHDTLAPAKVESVNVDALGTRITSV